MMLSQEAQAKILSLAKEIDGIYKNDKLRPSGVVCDICGSGDTIAKTGFIYRARACVNGYELRKKDSPRLCHRHASGWALSHNAYNWDGKRSWQEIDLHFAQYLAKQLIRSVK
jgi:hypothetical protein